MSATVEPSAITTSLTYTVPPTDGSRLEVFTPEASSTGNYERNYTTRDETVQLENLRGKEDTVSLDTTGFQYFKRAAKHTDFSDDTDIEKGYYPESVDLLKELTGAAKVVIFDHTVRRNNLMDKDPKNRKPAGMVHIDQTRNASISRVHRHIPDEAEFLLKKRFQIINLWRPIKHAAYDCPLALCDFRSMDIEKDTYPVALIYPDFEGETMAVKYNPSHQWKYLRGMTPEEGVLIKCFDSKDDGSTALFSPHTAFNDPTTPDASPVRESIEIRALVFYD